MPNIRSDDDPYRSQLTDAEYNVLRLRGTEPAGSGEYNKMLPSSGYFSCRACGKPLYSAAAKFESGCGWPAFSRCYVDALKCQPDLEQFESCGGRVEISCAGCSSHLGHVFFEGDNPTRKKERHCVNSLSIRHVDGLAHVATVAGAEEQSLRDEYEACMQRALMMLMGGGAPAGRGGRDG